MTRNPFSLAGMLLLMLAAAACDEPVGPERAPESPSSLSPSLTAASPTPSAKSIIRPSLVETPPPEPRLTVERAVVPFSDRGTDFGEVGRARLDALLATPTMRAGGPIELRGHSDSRGHDADNLVTSRRRAEVVGDYLESHGIARDRMTVLAFGETRPIAPNSREDASDNPEGRARNRRVEVIVRPPADEPEAEPMTAEPVPAAS